DGAVASPGRSFESSVQGFPTSGQKAARYVGLGGAEYAGGSQEEGDGAIGQCRSPFPGRGGPGLPLAATTGTVEREKTYTTSVYVIKRTSINGEASMTV